MFPVMMSSMKLHADQNDLSTFAVFGLALNPKYSFSRTNYKSCNSNSFVFCLPFLYLIFISPKNVEI